MPFEYVQPMNRYRDTDTGRFVSQITVNGIVRDSIEHSSDGIGELATLTANGDVSATTFNTQARIQIKDEYLRQYILGRGGRNNMTQRDWGIVGRQLRDQYAFLDNLTNQIASGVYEDNVAGLHNRLNLYIESAQQAYSTAQTEDRGIPRLSQVPADGQTICMTRCKCTLEFVRTVLGWHIFWRLNPSAAHCTSCLSLAAAWSPLIFADGSFTNFDSATLTGVDWIADEIIVKQWIDLIESGADYALIEKSINEFEHVH